MRLTDTREHFDRELSFPADRETVLETVGDEHLESSGGDDVRIREVLAAADAESWESADSLHHTVSTHVDDEFVGRTDYSDRSTPLADDEGREDVSF